MEEYQYTAFISYRHQSPDDEIAKKLHTMIETYSIPGNVRKSSGRKKMERVFRDEEELPLSKDLGGDIRKALENSEWFIAICSPRYLESRWCKAELEYFIELGKRDHILTVLVEGEPGDSFPEELLYEMKDGDKVEVEPLAADVRGDTLSASLQKLKSEKLRIIAPILDVAYDELRQRERRRKTQRTISALAAVFLLLTGFLIYAVMKNNEITKQRDVAVNNEMLLLIEQANIDGSSGNKLPALQTLLKASDVRDVIGERNDKEFSAALEYALYNGEFESLLHIDNNNRQFDELVFSNDDRYLLGITNLNSACLIDAKTGKILFTVSRSDIGQLDSVGFTKDDRYFYMVDSWYGFVSLYSVENGELYRQYDASDGYAWNIGEKVFPMSQDRILIFKQKAMVIWNYETDTEEEILPCGDKPFETYTQPLIVTLSDDESKVFVGSHGYEAGMQVMSLDGKRVIPLEYDKERGYMNVTFSKDGRFCAATSTTLFDVWNADTGECVFEGDNGDISLSQNVILSDDGRILIVMSSNYLRAYDTIKKDLLWEHTTESNIMTEAYLSPNGRFIASSGGINGVYDTYTGECLYEEGATLFSHDDRLVLSHSYDNKPALLSTPVSSTSSLDRNFKESLYHTVRFTEPTENITVELKHNCGDFYKTYPGNANRQALWFTDEDLRYAVHTDYDGFIEVFDISDPKNTTNIYCLAEHCYSCVSDLIIRGDLMASCGGYDPRVVLFDLREGQIRFVLAGNEYCHTAELSRDGSKVVFLCGFGAKDAYVYSTETGNLLYHLSAPEEDRFTEVGFTEDGKKVAALLDKGGAMTGVIYPDIGGMLEEARKR